MADIILLNPDDIYIALEEGLTSGFLRRNPDRKSQEKEAKRLAQDIYNCPDGQLTPIQVKRFNGTMPYRLMNGWCRHMAVKMLRCGFWLPGGHKHIQSPDLLLKAIVVDCVEQDIVDLQETETPAGKDIETALENWDLVPSDVKMIAAAIRVGIRAGMTNTMPAHFLEHSHDAACLAEAINSFVHELKGDFKK